MTQAKAPTGPARLASSAVRGIAPYVIGKPIDELARELGVTDIIKLASNENPLGPSPRALKAMQESLRDVWLYPDGIGHDLKQALAAWHRVDAKQVTRLEQELDALNAGLQPLQVGEQRADGAPSACWKRQ